MLCLSRLFCRLYLRLLFALLLSHRLFVPTFRMIKIYYKSSTSLRYVCSSLICIEILFFSLLFALVQVISCSLTSDTLELFDIPPFLKPLSFARRVTVTTKIDARATVKYVQYVCIYFIYIIYIYISVGRSLVV